MPTTREALGEEERYRALKVTPGGVMLLVRLRADMARLPEAMIRRAAIPEGAADLPYFPETPPRLRTTLKFMETQFGKPASVRVVVETAAELLNFQKKVTPGG